MEDVKELSGEIIYVTTPERAINYKWEKNFNKLSPEIQVVSIEDIQNIGRDVFDNKRILLNTLLVKHPFIPNKYIEIDRTEEAITKSKLNCLGIILRYLGVSEYETTFALENNATVTIDANGNASYKFVEGGLKTKKISTDNETRKYYRHEAFSGEFSIDNYEKAVDMAKKFGLYGDEDIYYLLQNRNPQDLNLLKSQEVKIELTRELNSSLDVAFNLSVSGIFKLNANYNETISKRKKITIETKLIF
jgi:hypothetical protein